jgi:hypothetical protein
MDSALAAWMTQQPTVPVAAAPRLDLSARIERPTRSPTYEQETRHVPTHPVPPICSITGKAVDGRSAWRARAAPGARDQHH